MVGGTNLGSDEIDPALARRVYAGQVAGAMSVEAAIARRPREDCSLP